ncbi:MAG: hypothetical protein AB1410_11000 [Acidobacteriota bacterium]
MVLLRKAVYYIFHSRRLIIFALFWGFLFLSLKFYMDPSDPDIYRHLKVGEIIYKSRAIPETELFTYAEEGSKWIHYSWLSEILFYIFFNNFSWIGLFVLRVLTGFFIIYYLFLGISRLNENIYFSIILVLLVILLIQGFFLIRPVIFSFLFFSIYLWIIFDFKYRKAKRLFFLPLIMLLWANVHICFIYGLILLFLVIFGEILNRFFFKDKSFNLKAFSFFTFLTFGSSLINPYLHKIYFIVGDYFNLGILKDFILEFHSPDFHYPILLIFPILLVLSSVCVALKKTDFVNILLISFFGYLGFDLVRNVPYFVILSLFIVSASLPDLWKEKLPEVKREKIPNVFFIFLNFFIYVGLIYGLMVVARNFKPDEIIKKEYPKEAVEYIKANKFGDKLINHFDWGSFLLYELYPEYKVSIDGRTPAYSKEYFKKFSKTHSGMSEWSEYVDHLKNKGANLIIWPRELPLSQILKERKDWKKIYEDKIAVIFLYSR